MVETGHIHHCILLFPVLYARLGYLVELMVIHRRGEPARYLAASGDEREPLARLRDHTGMIIISDKIRELY